MDANTTTTQTGPFTIEGPLAKGLLYRTRLSARAAADRMDNKYGAYRHTVRVA